MDYILVRNLTAREAAEISDALEADGVIAEKDYQEDYNVLIYKKGTFRYEIHCTNDSSWWVIGGAVYAEPTPVKVS